MKATEDGMSKVDAASTFSVGRRTIYDWIELVATTNNLAPKQNYQNGHSHSIKNLKEFEVFAQNNKHCSTKEMAHKWSELKGKKVSRSTMSRALHKIGYTFKKNIYLQRG